jgi:hypothetical protein
MRQGRRTLTVSEHAGGALTLLEEHQYGELPLDRRLSRYALVDLPGWRAREEPCVERYAGEEVSCRSSADLTL